MPIAIEISSPKCKLAKKNLERLTQEVLRSIQKTGSRVSVFVVSSAKMRALHRKYFKDPRDTDCISFSQFEGKPCGKGRILGDVFLSWDQVRRQAPQYEHTPEEELLYCLIHGILHLIGYEDRRPPDRKKMFARQDKIFHKLRKLG